MDKDWKTGEQYKKGDIVGIKKVEYLCLIDHKSDVFSNDLHGISNNPYPGIWKRINAPKGKYN